MIHLRKRFFTQCSSLFDLAVGILCLVSFIIDVSSPTTTEAEETEAVFSTVILAARNALQILRIVLIVKVGRSMQSRQKMQDIDLPNMKAMAVGDLTEDEETRGMLEWKEPGPEYSDTPGATAEGADDDNRIVV